MDQEPSPARRPPWQFTLGSLMISVVFVALACAAVKHLIGWVLHRDSPLGPLSFVCWFSVVPILLCGGIGVLRGRLKSWLCYGVVIDLALLGYVLFGTRSP